jgi:hypothetical protein
MVFKKAYLGTTFQETKGKWTARRSEKVGKNFPAFIVEFQNAARAEKNVGGSVQAFIEFHDPEGGNTGVKGCWLEEYLTHAEFPVDTIHKLLLGLTQESGKLTAVGRLNNMFAGEFPTELIPVTGTPPWHAYVRLTDANGGDLLYEGNFQLTLDPPAIARA